MENSIEHMPVLSFLLANLIFSFIGNYFCNPGGAIFCSKTIHRVSSDTVKNRIKAK
jgi:hypothetical protein